MMSKKSPQLRFEGFTDDWEERKLGEISKTTIGEFVIKTKQSDESPYPVYNGGRSYTGKYDEYNNDGPKIVISARGANAGFVNYVSGRYWAGNSCYSVSVTKEDEFSIGYLYQFIKYNQVLFTAYQQAANIPSVSKSDVEKFSIKYPTVLEQKKIESFFKQLDNTIALHQRKLLKLKNVKKAMLEKMFPKNGSTVPEIRFAGFTDAWEQRKLGNLTQIKTGSSDLQDSVEDGQYPFFVRSENIERSNRYIFDGEAILIPGEGRLGDIYHYINGKFDFHQRVYKISGFEDSNTDGKYILYYMQKNFKQHAMRFTVKATVDSLRLPMLTDFDVVVPKIEEQRKISNLFANLDSLITLHQRELVKLKGIKDLFGKMFI